jgi:hypothetical protein
MKKDIMTEQKAKKSPAGGVLVGKREGQTIIHDKGTQGGYFLGKLHKEGGIKGVNKSTGQPIEVQGGEVIITAPAVADQTKREFEGQMLTNREILSKINEKGGGVSLENGGEIYYTGSSYNYGGKTMTDYEIMQSMNDCGNEIEYKKGGVITYKDKYNRKFKYPKGTSHDLEEISKDTGVSVKGLQQIYNKGIGAYKTNPESVRPNVKSKEQWAMARVYSAVMGGKASKVDSNELKMNNGGLMDLQKQSKKGDHPARDLNNYNDVLDMEADGIVGAETGLFADGGDLDFLDEAVEKFDDGGSTTNEIDSIILESGSFGFFDEMPKKEYTSFKDFISDLQSVFISKNKGTGYFYFSVYKNGNKIIPNRLAIQFKNSKNTVLNFNPLTGKSSDFYKQIERRYGSSIRRNNLDFTNWLGGKSTPKPQPEPTPEPIQKQEKEEVRIDFEATKKYLTIRIADLTKELNFKKPRLSNEEVGFYQRDINNLIEKLRIANEKQLRVLPIKDRLESAYSLKWGNINAEFTPSKDLFAPNGLPTKLTDEEWVNVRSPYFDSFFGDWRLANEIGDFSGVSKVIDPETKEPMPVYHGTNVLFTEWKTYKSNNAHYFAKNRDFSQWFAEQWSKGRGDISAKDSNLLKALNPNKGEYLYRCFLDIKNPIDFSRFGVEKRPVSDFLMFLQINYNIGDFDFWTNFRLFNNLAQDTLVYSWMIIRNWQSFTEYIKMATTYDGYIFYEYHPEKVGTGLDGASLSYCAFDSNQIKFTTATEFNALITDSRFEQGGKL